MKDWLGTKLGKVIDLKTGFPFKSDKYSENPSDIRLLRGDNIVQGRLRWDDVQRWPRSEAHEYNDYTLQQGDVVLAMDRPWIEAGLKQACIKKGRSSMPAGATHRTTQRKREATNGLPALHNRQQSLHPLHKARKYRLERASH